MTASEQIDKGIAAHSQWKTRLNNAIKNGTSEYVPAIVSTDNACDFGKWLYGEGKVLKSSPHYEEVKKLHADFHKEASIVLQLALSGQIEKAKEAMALKSTFYTVSSNMVLLLMKWKKGL
jgi:hypothetical protein